MNWEKVVEILRQEASASLKVADEYRTNDPVWTARAASAHTLFALANALAQGEIHATKDA